MTESLLTLHNVQFHPTVLFSMYDYESAQTASTTAATNLASSLVSSSSSSSSPPGYLTKNDVAALCADTTFALAEILPSPPSILKQLGADGGSSGGGSKGQQGTAAATARAHWDATGSPFKELTSVMVDVAFAKVIGGCLIGPWRGGSIIVVIAPF